jgi:hypothetical protein
MSSAFLDSAWRTAIIQLGNSSAVGVADCEGERRGGLVCTDLLRSAYYIGACYNDGGGTIVIL